MESNSKNELIAPPKLIEALTSGFNAIANNIYLVLFPVALDTFLWLGPHLRIKQLVEPIIIKLAGSVSDISTPEFGNIGEMSKEIWELVLTQFNLISLLRTFPIGIPSLMSGLSPTKTPLGTAALFEVNGFIETILFWLLFSILGIVLGSVYFDGISRSTSHDGTFFSVSMTGSSIKQIFIFSIISLFVLIIFMIPTLSIISVLTLISPALGEIALLFIGIIVIWFVMPLAFAPHGVFTEGKSIFSSISTSIRLVRNYLPGTGMFFLTAILIYQGLNILWETAPETSWMSLVGIFGHSFISTGLIASSFVYYRNGISWMENKQRQSVVNL